MDDDDSDEDDRPKSTSSVKSVKKSIFSNVLKSDFWLAYQPQPQYNKPSKSLLNEDADLLKLVQDMHQ